MNDKSTINECEENLQEAKATIVLQQKQLASYERLINKQNEKIQLLRSFICKHHSRHQLDKLETGRSTSSSSSSASSKTHSTNSRRTIPSSLKQKATIARSKPSTNADSNMMHIRLGQKDMHSFFFDTDESSSQTRHWETISSISHTNNNRDAGNAQQTVEIAPPTLRSRSPPPLSVMVDNNQDTNVQATTTISAHVGSHSPQSPRSITEISSQSSHTTDDGTFTIEGTPQRYSRIVSPIAITPVHHRHQQQRQQQQQQQTDALWETLTHYPKSPSDRHHHTRNQKQKQKQKQNQPSSVYNNYQPSTAISTFGQHWDELYQGSGSTSAAAASSSTATHKRNSLATIEANLLQNDDYFLKRQAPESDFPYAEVVRKKDERAKLHGVTCTCCAKYFESSAGTPTTIQDRIQKYSRHREKYKRPSTPPGFWDLDFPDSPLH